MERLTENLGTPTKSIQESGHHQAQEQLSVLIIWSLQYQGLSPSQKDNPLLVAIVALQPLLIMLLLST